MARFDRIKHKHNDLTLRPWSEVARLYSERTGEHMTGKNAEVIAAKAIAKMNARLTGRGAACE